MKIAVINNNYTNLKKTNNILITAPNITRTKSSVSFTGTDKFIGQINKEYLNTFLEFCKKIDRAKLPLRGDGNEEGLNRVVGLAGLKTGLYQDVLIPLMDVMDGKPKHHLVPNGIHFFGPMDTGRTFFTQQLGQHYALKGGYHKNLMDKLSCSATQGTQELEKAFWEAEKRFIESGKRKYTMFSLDAIDCYFGKNKDTEFPSKNKFIELTENCKDKGVILLTNSDFIERMEPILLKNGRTDLRIPLNFVPNEDLPSMIDYYIKRDKLPVDDLINYRQIVDAVNAKGLKYKPKELEHILIRECENCVDINERLGTQEIQQALAGRTKREWENNEIMHLEDQKAIANQLGGVYEY